MNPLVTVIVPLYNVEQYLEQCVDSILEQEYDNLEIMLIDDGSTDLSGVICDRYKEQDSRIVVIHKKNGGIGDARNTGVRLSKGEYIAFVDSDDYISSDYITYLLKLLSEYNADLAVCTPFVYYEGENKKINNTEEKIEQLSSLEAIEHYLYKRKFTAAPYCKLYKRKLFKNVEYPTNCYYEDMGAMCPILSNADKIVVSNQMKYYYRQRRESVMNCYFNIHKMDRIKISAVVEQYIVYMYPELENAAKVRGFIAGIQTLRELPKDKEIWNKYISVIKKQIFQYRKATLMDKKANISIRIMALVSYLGIHCLKNIGILYTYIMKKI